jgi:hypothetical protein
METMQQQLARMHYEAKERAGALLNPGDLVLAEQDAKNVTASARMVTDMAKALAVQISALWDAVELLAATRE